MGEYFGLWRNPKSLLGMFSFSSFLCMCVCFMCVWVFSVCVLEGCVLGFGGGGGGVIQVDVTLGKCLMLRYGWWLLRVLLWGTDGCKFGWEFG